MRNDEIDVEPQLCRHKGRLEIGYENALVEGRIRDLKIREEFDKASGRQILRDGIFIQ